MVRGYIHIVGWVGRVYEDFLFSVRIVGEPARTWFGVILILSVGWGGFMKIFSPVGWVERSVTQHFD